MPGTGIPVWEQYTLSVEEAAMYFHIGESKLRTLINNNPKADYIIRSGNKTLIKRKKFEMLIDSLDAI